MPSLPAARDDDEPGVPCILHGVIERLRIFRFAQAHVDDVGAVGDGSGDGLLNGEVVAASVRAADLVGEDAGIGRYADDAFRCGRIPGRIVQGRGNGSCDVRAVAVIVHRVAVAERRSRRRRRSSVPGQGGCNRRQSRSPPPSRWSYPSGSSQASGASMSASGVPA